LIEKQDCRKNKKDFFHVGTIWNYINQSFEAIITLFP